MMNQLEQNTSTPLYSQLASALRSAIECGEFAQDAQIPTEAALGQKYDVSRITVRKAVDELIEEGLLTRCRGKGTFVTMRKPVSNNYPFMSFDQACRTSGKEPRTTLLSYTLEPPGKKTSAFLKLNSNDRVITIKRLRVADDQPVSVETEIFPESFTFLSQESLVESMTTVLSRHNLYPVHGSSVITICYANAEESELLGVEEDAPLLRIYNEIRDQSRKPLQISKQIVRPDCYEIRMEF